MRISLNRFSEDEVTLDDDDGVLALCSSTNGRKGAPTIQQYTYNDTWMGEGGGGRWINGIGGRWRDDVQ